MRPCLGPLSRGSMTTDQPTEGALEWDIRKANSKGKCIELRCWALSVGKGEPMKIRHPMAPAPQIAPSEMCFSKIPLVLFIPVVSDTSSYTLTNSMMCRLFASASHGPWSPHPQLMPKLFLKSKAEAYPIYNSHASQKGIRPTAPGLSPGLRGLCLRGLNSPPHPLLKSLSSLQYHQKLLPPGSLPLWTST